MNDQNLEPFTVVIAEINLTSSIEKLPDQDRIQWITALLETISEEGTIETVRDLVNQERWNDQKPE